MPELRLGKIYVRRDGKKTGPLVLTKTVHPSVADQYPFCDPDNDVTYTPNGALLSEGPGHEHNKDLIKEFIEDRNLPDLTVSNANLCVLWN